MKTAGPLRRGAWVAVLSVCAFGAWTASSPAQGPWKFDFRPGRAEPGYVQVPPATVYSAERGFGFEPVADGASFFSVAVPEGTYRVTATLGDPARRSETTVFAELRRLMAERVVVAPGILATQSFLVSVRRPAIRGGGEVVLKDREKTTEAWAWDDKLTLEFNGSGRSVARVTLEPADVPTVYLLGDSTMCDQPREPFNSWGQMLTRFLKPDVVVSNHAESGESVSGALAAGRFDKIWREMKTGDYLFVQFGHNDMKSEAPGALDTFAANMTRVVSETRHRGGLPVLVTSVSRRTFDQEGKTITDSFKGYTQAVRTVATAGRVPLIDLQSCSAALYEALGSERSHLAFATMQEGTHHNDYGSYQIVKCVLMGMKNARLDLAHAITDDFHGFDPASPDSLDTFMLPKSPLTTTVTPAGR
jgi:lysophospholipase L1-like esterase